MTIQQWHIIGVGTGWGARNMGTADGPEVLCAHMPLSLRDIPKSLTNWHGQSPLNFSNPLPLPTDQSRKHADHVFEMANRLSADVKNCFLKGEIPLVLGGDHSTAIGTWSGVRAAVNEDIGLIWIDAHMDAHTPQTSPSLNIHGMPVAVLLGQGENRFTDLEGIIPKIRPENLCLIGVRSFEDGEEAFLKNLGVRVYMMKEVCEKGFEVVFEEARRNLVAHKFGLSIDVDAFDPQEAPGTGTPEDCGLWLQNVEKALHGLALDPAFLALEITEFNPHRDLNGKTCRFIWNLITTIVGEYDDKEQENDDTEAFNI